jgi:hypothetical protein
VTEALLEAGLLPLDGAVEDVDRVRPRTYRHSNLGMRPVVGLTVDTVASGEDRALAFLGFGDPAVGDPVALGRPRGLGYPAWALVHDPGHAKVALEAVADLERAARLAGTKPGRAIETFEATAGQLPVSHLPSFWEQAGRTFVAAGSPKQGVPARRAEAKALNLPVETWKIDMYGLAVPEGGQYLTGPLYRFLPLRPLTELFAAAWRRVENGDQPR